MNLQARSEQQDLWASTERAMSGGYRIVYMRSVYRPPQCLHNLSQTENLPSEVSADIRFERLSTYRSECCLSFAAHGMYATSQASRWQTTSVERYRIKNEDIASLIMPYPPLLGYLQKLFLISSYPIWLTLLAGSFAI